MVSNFVETFRRLQAWINATPILGLLPIVLILAGLEYTHNFGGAFPVPFLLIFYAIVLAAVLGGRTYGLIAAVLGSFEILHSHLVSFGPPTLTGSVGSTAFGIVLSCTMGFWLGLLRDQRDATLAHVAQHRKSLEADLRVETREREQSHTELAKNEVRLETAFRLARMGHFEFETTTGNCVFCSARHAAHFGLTPDEFVAQTLGWEPSLEFVHPDDRQDVKALIKRIRSGEVVEFEYRCRHKDGSIRYIREVVEPEFDAEGRVTREIGTSQDLTDLRETEGKLRESQRLEAIGQLTAGVAHDFNNLLAVIMGNLELLSDATSAKDAEEMIESALGATERGAALTGKLLSFGRKSMLNPEMLDLCTTISELGSLFRRTLPTSIEIGLPGISGECVAYLDRVQFESAMLNLVVNARDAMPQGGKLTIDGARRHYDIADIRKLGLEMEPGEYISIIVADTGTGMTQEVRARALEPFYSTKGVGNGSGLGLSMVLGFAKQSGGDVGIASENGKGTTISLYFKAGSPQAVVQHIVGPVEIAKMGNGALILLVEDDANVRAVTARQIISLGYRVLEAETGQIALDLLRKRSDVALVLSDVVMPGDMQGPELVAKARALSHSPKCVLMSGYYSTLPNAITDTPLDVPRLTKPISRAELGLCLSQVMRG